MDGKTTSKSYTEQVHMINAASLNGYGRLFGGTLLSWIDIVAGIVARRHTNTNITTAAIDNLNFLAPAHANDLVVLCGKVSYTGRTSVEVCVKSYVEALDGSRTLINTAYVVMVALDENEKPTEVPKIIPTTDEEKADFEAGISRAELRKLRKRHNI